jgi:hypothetical protein
VSGSNHLEACRTRLYRRNCKPRTIGTYTTSHAFLERWFPLRHQAGDTLWGKLAVGVGGTAGQAPAEDLERFFLYNIVETVTKCRRS